MRWNTKDPSNGQRAGKRGEEKKARGGRGQETRLHRHMLAVKQYGQSLKSSPLGKGVSTAFAMSRDVLPAHRSTLTPAAQSNLDSLWVGKAFTTTKRRGHRVAVPLPVGTEVSDGLMCCLSLGLRMGFVICLALFMSLW